MLERNYRGRSFEVNKKVIDASTILYFSIETIMNAQLKSGYYHVLIYCLEKTNFDPKHARVIEYQGLRCVVTGSYTNVLRDHIKYLVSIP